MEQNLLKIKDFRDIFSILTPDSPRLISQKSAIDLADMIGSEVDELKEAIEKGDLAGILDAIIDIDYFTKQAVHTFGLQHIYQIAFDRVHVANMSKPCDSYKHAIETQEKYKEQYIDTYIEENKDFGKFLVKRSDTGKCLKAKGWQEPVFDDLLK